MEQKTMPSKDPDKKTMDIAKPGNTAPDTTSRPVLVTHRPMVQDPMVNQTKKDDDESEGESKQITTHGSKTLQPVDTSLKRDDSEAAKQTSNPDSESKKEEAVIDAVVGQAESKQKQGELSGEEKAKQEHVQKLINDKTYFVSIGQVAKRRNRQMYVILLVLILAVMGVYVAIDAGFIKTSIKLPVDFIKN